MSLGKKAMITVAAAKHATGSRYKSLSPGARKELGQRMKRNLRNPEVKAYYKRVMKDFKARAKVV